MDNHRPGVTNFVHVGLPVVPDDHVAAHPCFASSAATTAA
jgi:hypothetical protein